MKLFEKVGALAHQLAHYVERASRILPDERAKLGAVDEECLCFVSRERIGDVFRVAAQSFDSESLARRDDRGNESAARSDSVSKNDVSAEYDRDSIRRRAFLIDLESGWPGRTRTVRCEHSRTLSV